MKKDHSLDAFTETAAYLRLLYTLALRSLPVIYHTLDVKRGNKLSRAIRYIDDLRFELDYELWHRYDIDAPSYYTRSGFTEVPADEVDRKVTDEARAIVRRVLCMDAEETESVCQCDTQSVTHSVTQSDTQSVTHSVTIPKRNQTKHKEGIEYPERYLKERIEMRCQGDDEEQSQRR